MTEQKYEPKVWGRYRLSENGAIHRYDINDPSKPGDLIGSIADGDFQFVSEDYWNRYKAVIANFFKRRKVDAKIVAFADNKPRIRFATRIDPPENPPMPATETTESFTTPNVVLADMQYVQQNDYGPDGMPGRWKPEAIALRPSASSPNPW